MVVSRSLGNQRVSRCVVEGKTKVYVCIYEMNPKGITYNTPAKNKAKQNSGHIIGEVLCHNQVSRKGTFNYIPQYICLCCLLLAKHSSYETYCTWGMHGISTYMYERKKCASDYYDITWMKWLAWVDATCVPQCQQDASAEINIP